MAELIPADEVEVGRGFTAGGKRYWAKDIDEVFVGFDFCVPEPEPTVFRRNCLQILAEQRLAWTMQQPMKFTGITCA